MSKENEISRNPEFDALKDIEGIDMDNLMGQAGLTPDVPKPPVAETPKPPVEKKVEGAAPIVDKPADNSQAQRDAFLKEIFGERFKTVDEAKQANIPGILDETEILRQEKVSLQEKLNLKPKTNFANDEVALFNEFVKETGTKDYGMFSRINSADVATMDSMEALVTKHILDNPNLAGKEANVRKYFEKKYNVDPDLVDEDDLAINRIGMEADGATAKKSLQSLKEKLKVPEPIIDVQKPKELTPEEKAQLQTGWGNVGEQVSTALGKLKVPIKNGKESLLDYEISDSEKKEITEFVKSYAVENRMELNETNVKTVSTMVYNQLMINKLPDIVHSVFEKARSLTEEQVHSLYENPSPARNSDTPPAQRHISQTDEDKMRDDIFNAEMGYL
ncbi:hypothetical protein KKC87_04255 [Patescibacteria group bacterium]|nr:hypothetical protein [Patescibacteria group bacterium]